jgi:hypothetical protein
LIERIPNYAFPFVLIALEMSIRYGLGVDTSQFIGPALAAAAAGVCVPHLARGDVSNTMPLELQQVLRQNGVEVVRESARRYAHVLQLLFFINLAVWCAAIVLGEKRDAVTWYGLSRSMWFGLITYLVSVLVVERKETA